MKNKTPGTTSTRVEAMEILPEGAQDNHANILAALADIASVLERQDQRLSDIQGTLDQHDELLRGRQQQGGTTAERLTEQALWDVFQQAEPGTRLDLSKYDSLEVDHLLRLLGNSGRERFPEEEARDEPEFDLGPHVEVRVNMWWGPFGEVRIQFDRLAVDNYNRAITFTNLAAVGVPIPVAGLVAGIINIMVAVASENGLIVWVQVPTLVHTPLPA